MTRDEAKARLVAELFPQAWDSPSWEIFAGVVGALPPSAVPHFDLSLRGRSWAGGPLKGDLSQWASEMPDLLLAASCHGSGHTREAAVRAMGERLDTRALPFLLLRLNDWVKQVREAAKAALRPRLTPEHADAWADLLPMLARLAEQSRDDHRWLIEGVGDLLVGDPGENGSPLDERGHPLPPPRTWRPRRLRPSPAQQRAVSLALETGAGRASPGIRAWVRWQLEAR